MLLLAVHSRWVGKGLHFHFAIHPFFALLCKEAFSHGVEQCIAQDAGGAGFSAGCLDIDGDVFDVDHDLLSFAVK
jgi:hypothetical protein